MGDVSEVNRVIATLYNQDKTARQIKVEIYEKFGKTLSVRAIYGRIKTMKNNGTLNFVDGQDDIDILSDLESEVTGRTGGFFKIGVLDIETTGLWSDFGYILCAVIKDLDAGLHQVFRLDECKSYNDMSFIAKAEGWRRIDKELLIKFRSAYEMYDIVIHFNGRNFDIKFLNTRLIKNGLHVLPEMKQLDIYQIAKHRLRLRSKRLDALKEFLEIDECEMGHKWEYWQMAAARITEGFDFVVDHCKRDVDRLTEVSRKLKPMINYVRT